MGATQNDIYNIQEKDWESRHFTPESARHTPPPPTTENRILFYFFEKKDDFTAGPTISWHKLKKKFLKEKKTFLPFSFKKFKFLLGTASRPFLTNT